MNRFRQKIQQFMYGRNGADDISRVAVWAALILMLISMFTKKGTVLYLVGMAALFYSLFRMYSRNISARRRENDKFLCLCSSVSGWFKKKKWQLTDLKTHKIYRCPNCRQKIRVPKGKGNIVIRCPKCGIEFKKRT